MKNDTTDKTERDLSDRKFYPAEEEAKFEKSQPRQTPQTAHPAYKLAFQARPGVTEGESEMGVEIGVGQRDEHGNTRD